MGFTWKAAGWLCSFAFNGPKKCLVRPKCSDITQSATQLRWAFLVTMRQLHCSPSPQLNGRFFLLFTARYSLLAIMVKWACRLQRAKKATRQYNGSWLLVNAKLALGDILLTHLHWFSFKHLFKIDGIKPKTFHLIDKNKPKQKRTRVPIAHHKQSTSKWNCLSLVHEIPTSRYSSVNWAKNVLSMRSTACH